MAFYHVIMIYKSVIHISFPSLITGPLKPPKKLSSTVPYVNYHKIFNIDAILQQNGHVYLTLASSRLKAEVLCCECSNYHQRLSMYCFSFYSIWLMHNFQIPLLFISPHIITIVEEKWIRNTGTDIMHAWSCQSRSFNGKANNLIWVQNVRKQQYILKLLTILKK